MGMATALSTRIEELLCGVRLLVSDLTFSTLCSEDVVASRCLVDAAELLCTQTVARYASDGHMLMTGSVTCQHFSRYVHTRCMLKVTRGSNGP